MRPFLTPKLERSDTAGPRLGTRFGLALALEYANVSRSGNTLDSSGASPHQIFTNSPLRIYRLR